MRPTRSVRAADRVEHAATGAELAAVDAEVGELADVGVGHDLERERGERLVVRGLARDRSLVCAGGQALDRRHVERARQVVDHRVEQRLHALVLEGGAAQHGGHRDVERGLADVLDEAIGLDRLLLEVVLHQLLVVLGHRLDQLGARLVGALGHVLGDVRDLPVLAEVVLVDDRLHVHEVDDALEVGLCADRQLHRHRVRAEAVDHRLDRALEVGADAVHLVDEGHARHAVLVGLAPDGLGLRLHACNRVEHGDGAVEHAQGALHLDGEVHVARRVDDVDAVIAPEGGGRGGGDRDAALLLLLHPVHHGRALVNLTHLVGASRVKEDALSRRRLSGVDVRHDSDVARVFE